MIKIIVIIFALTPLTSFALPVIGGLSVQPIVGIERVQKLTPTIHSKQRLTYGVRVMYGPPMFSLEAEVTKADDTEEFNEKKLSIKEESTAAKLGIRSSLDLVLLRWFLRAGGHARQSKLTTTQTDAANVTTTTIKKPGVRVSPYAGTGFRINLPLGIFMNGGLTVIFTGHPRGEDREYQADLGWGISF